MARLWCRGGGGGSAGWLGPGDVVGAHGGNAEYPAIAGAVWPAPRGSPVFTDPAQPLVAGSRYLVTLFTAESGASGPTLTEIARQEFVP